MRGGGGGGGGVGPNWSAATRRSWATRVVRIHDKHIA